MFKEYLKNIPKSYYFFGIFAFLFVALLVFVEIKNGKFWTNDLRVYVEASSHFFEGENPYTVPYGLGSGYFKYPPTNLYLFGLLSLLKFGCSQFFHTAILTISLIGSILILHRQLILPRFSLSAKKSAIWLYLFFIIIAVQVVREIHLGNVNLVLLFLFLIGVKAYLSNRSSVLIIVWSFMILLKPIVILVLLPLMIQLQWKTIAKITFIGVLFFALPVIHLGREGLALWESWFRALEAHGASYQSTNCLQYISGYYFRTHSDWIPALSILTVFMFFMVLDFLKKRQAPDFIFSWSAVFLAFTPNFFMTDTEHFLLSLPVIALLVNELLKRQSPYFWILFIFLLVGFSLNSTDLWGKELSIKMSEFAVLGLSNFGLIVFYLILKIHSSIKDDLALSVFKD